jgi:oligo-1,6-glucosidase
MTTNKWWQNSVVYQIYPRSFADSNGDGIGDLNGITEHLDYLKDLGVDVLWLSPIYQSPNDDNGYDISDYRAIQSDFGTMEDFDRLLSEAHRRGLKLLMDLVVNHTSDEHPWFQESRKSKDNPYRDYYIWKDPKPDGSAPNNWGSVFSGSAWKLDEATGQYYLHLFSKKQPDLNWENPKVREAIYDMMCWWCDKGIDGFRMDTASFYAKSNYNDGPLLPGSRYGSFGPSSLNQPKIHTYLREMNEKVFSHYDVMSVGETGGVTIPDALKYANLDGSELSMVFQFSHVDCGDRVIGKWTDEYLPMPLLRESLNKWQLGLAGKAWNSLYFDNHDQPRAVSRFGNDAPMWRELSAKMLATCLHMMQGTPYVYQGEELGMTNAYFKHLSDYRDIETLNAWKECVESGEVPAEAMLRYLQRISRDNARTPFQWNAERNAGFTTGTPWISVCKNYLEINAHEEAGDPDSVLNYYRRLIALRKSYPILVQGEFVPLLKKDPAVYAWERRYKEETLVVACNFTDRAVSCKLFAKKDGTELISNYHEHTEGTLQPYEARVMLYRA